MLFTTWVIVVSLGVGLGEYFNCKYPRVEEGYSSEGFVCNWEDDDFYKEDGKWVLTQSDSTDNCFEEKARKKYWDKK
tara:strand:+ start:311 stop:541 length:231 start_codon:yes stop_codon:yes gene_type:complete